MTYDTLKVSLLVSIHVRSVIISIRLSFENLLCIIISIKKNSKKKSILQNLWFSFTIITITTSSYYHYKSSLLSSLLLLRFIVIMILIMIKIMSIISITIQSQAAFVSCLHLARFTIVHSKTQSIKLPLLYRRTPITRTLITRSPNEPNLVQFLGGDFTPLFSHFYSVG